MSQFFAINTISVGTVVQALNELDLMGKVKVIIMELACPKKDQDLPVSSNEIGFQFMKG